MKLYCNDWKTGKSQTEKITNLVKSVIAVWNRAGIPVRGTSSIRLKVTNLISAFKYIINMRRNSNDNQVKREEDFISTNQHLFDVVDSKLENSMSNVKRAFLSDQRGARLQNISNFYSNMIPLNDEIMNYDYENSDESSGESSESSKSNEYCPSSSDDEEVHPKKKLKRETIAKLEDAGLSFRQMRKVTEAFIDEFDQNPNDYCMGVSTFHSNSTRIRSENVEKTRSDVLNRNSKVVLLFDTKNFDQLNAVHLPRSKRLAIALHDQKSFYGLEICSIDNGTADTISEQLMNASIDFNLAQRIIGLSCDNEPTNTGQRSRFTS